MRYIFDLKKRKANLKKHGYDFEDAQQVIESGRTVTLKTGASTMTNSVLSRWACFAAAW